MALHCRHSVAEAEQLAEALNRQRPGSVRVFQADLLDSASLPGLVAEVIAHFGKLDGVVNNASSFFPTALGDIDEAAWAERAMLNVAGMGGFSSDRTIEEYVERVWSVRSL